MHATTMTDNARPNSSRQPLLIFEHIPKTAGSTMHGILWQLYRPQRVFMSCIPGQHRDRVDQLTRSLSEPDCPVRIFINHVGYGAHTHLGQDVTCRHFTFLRDPVERTVSHYFYHQKHHPESRGQSIAEYLSGDPLRRRNTQAVRLSGDKAAIELGPNPEEAARQYEPSSDLLSRAADVLEKNIDAFGFTERFDEALAVFRRTFDWPLLPSLYIRRNVNGQRRATSEFSAADLKRIRQANEIDIELYRLAQRLYQQQIESLGVDLERDVANYRRLNRVYRVCRPIAYPIARPLVHFSRRVRRFQHA